MELIVRFYRADLGIIGSYNDLNARRSNELPIVITQARSLILLLNDKTSLKDFIGESDCYADNKNEHRVKFGVLTGRCTIDNIDVVLEKLLITYSMMK